MATAAPSAVAAGGEGSAASTPAPVAQPEGSTRKIAPIPPKKAATGPAKGDGPEAVVHKDDAPRETEPDRQPKRSVLPGVVTSEDAPELPVRGPDGKFISRDEAERRFAQELAGEDEPDDGVRIEGDEPLPEKVAAEPPKKPTLPGQGKVTFLGKTYDSIAAVEQMYRSLQGMHDPIAKKLAETEKERDSGYMIANQWEQIARDAQAKLEQYERTGRQPATGQAPAGAAGPDVSDLDALVDGINYDAFEAIAHDPQGGTRVAGRYLASQILNTVMGQIVPALKAEVMKEITPVKQTIQMSTADAQTANRVTQVINEVATYQNMKGEPAFPELLDENELVEIASTWRESGLPPQHALTHQGLIQAIGLYRLMKSLPAGTDVATAVAEGAIPGPEIAALAEGGEGAHTGLGRAPESGSPEVRELRRGFDAAPLFDKTLGFTVRRRR